MNVTVPWKASTENPVNGVTSKLDDVRRALSQEAEHLAQVAAQFGRDASAHASDLADDAANQSRKLAADTSAHASTIARDPVGTASGFAQTLMKTAADVGSAIALSGRKAVDDASYNAQSVARDLKNVRITTEPQKSGPNFAAGVTLLAGFGGGLALMYFLDPERGRRRRAMLRDQLMKWTRVTREVATGKAKDLGNRAQGLAYETTKAVQGVAGGTANPDADTGTWETTSADTGYIDHGALASGSNGGTQGSYGGDPSTTDTWGEQPQPSSSERIEIS
jgi:hypothetical protein